MASSRAPVWLARFVAAITLVGGPALAVGRPHWTAQVGDFFGASEPASVKAEAPEPKTTAVAAFPDVVPERPAAPPDPALELLSQNPYSSELSARLAHDNLFGSDLDREDPYAEQLRFANPYTEELHLTNPYAAARQASAPRARAETPGLENPYTAARVATARHAEDADLTNPYTRASLK